MDILVMPLSRAKALIPLWNDTQNSNLFFLIIGFLIFIIAMCFAGEYASLWYKGYHYHFKAVMKTSAAVVIAILGFSIIIGDMNDGNSARDCNIGAIDNVGAYYKMKHLREIYPKLPCQSQINKRACQTKSINKATEYRNKHTFTKSQASKEYNELRKVYRRDGSPNTNNTKSLHPVKPKWWNYIWA